MVATPAKRASVGSTLFALATFAVVLLFVIIAARRPYIVAAQSAMVEAKFRQASSLQTLRLYVDHVREAQEALWLDRTPASIAAYLQAQDWFGAHLRTVARTNPRLATHIRFLYERYARDTARLASERAAQVSPLLTRDYAQLEEYVFDNTMHAYDIAYAQQGAYDAFSARMEASGLGLSLAVAAATLLLLALSQLYRVRLQRLSDERIALLADAAMKDALTGLRNLRAFEEDVHQAAAVALRCNYPIALVLLDVDGFKEANDRSGHATGDDILKGIAARLSMLREADGVYRIGGDEFAIILPATKGSGAEILARRLLEHAISDGRSPVTLSAGIAQLRAGEALSDWRERADIALYEAKRRGGDTAVLFENIEAQARFVGAQSVSRVRELLAKQGVQIAFQPIWNHDADRIVAFEALARPQRAYRFAGPREAFDAAQRIGRTLELDLLCMRAALSAVRDNRLEMPIFLNVTPATLEHPLFHVGTIAALLAEYEIDPSRVVMEITERTIRDLDTVVRRAGELRERGIRIALDDAGTGSSGLTLLSSLRFDFVKLDRSVLLEGQRANASGVIAGILAIGDSMGAVLIAEGIESPELLEFARNLHRTVPVRSAGVRAFQGYLLGRPRIVTPSRKVASLFGGLDGRRKASGKQQSDSGAGVDEAQRGVCGERMTVLDVDFQVASE
jgi:diguanylate cyclase (GGDEF)-like protein